ncbi:MAG: ABC transporter substrate-binding protein [Pseudomonadota bacterium]
MKKIQHPRIGKVTWRCGLAIALLALTKLALASDKPAQRIVSVGGAVTEIIYALGAQARIVGVDTTSLWPESTRGLPQVGYLRNLSAEGVLSLNPDLVITTVDAGPPEALEQIRGVGVQVTILENDPTAAGIAKKIRGTGQAIGLAQSAEELAASVESQLSRQSARVATIDKKPAVLFLLSIGRGSPLASGVNTAANGIIELAGGRNATDGYEGYKPISAESLVAAAPDAILVTNRTLAMMGGLDKLLEIPGIAATPAGLNKRIVAMDGLYLLGLGPRTPQAVADFTAKLHPQLSSQASATQ